MKLSTGPKSFTIQHSSSNYILKKHMIDRNGLAFWRPLPSGDLDRGGYPASGDGLTRHVLVNGSPTREFK